MAQWDFGRGIMKGGFERGGCFRATFCSEGVRIVAEEIELKLRNGCA